MRPFPTPMPSPTYVYADPAWEAVSLGAAATVLAFVISLLLWYWWRRRRERQFAERVARYLRDKV